MDKIEKIRQKIERHRQAIRVLSEHTAPEQTSKTCAIFQYSDTILSELLSFLDTLSEEPNKSLEEAAEEYRRESYRKSVMPNTDGPIPEYGGNVKDAFIAGAEWMAKQGYSLEYIIQYGWGVSDTSTESKKATLSFPLPADIFEGDKVIIQIRKK